MTSAHLPERTCIGCRKTFPKGEVVRIVASPEGAVIDYREKLPGRAAYVCPRAACIAKALEKNALSRALRTAVTVPAQEQFLALLRTAIIERARSLLGTAAKAGKLLTGYSAVRDGLDKGTIHLLMFAADCSEGTREKVHSANKSAEEATLLTGEELGMLAGGGLTVVAAITDRGLADAVRRETARLNGLPKAGR